MLKLKVAYDDNSEDLIKELQELIPVKFPLIELETYHEELFQERKKAFKLKGGFSARKSPFAVLVDSDNGPIIAFYSENDKCNLDTIVNTLSNNLISYQ